jgi:GT2 family glycosyltransferase/glycosyltransferase involved in cell wall biosynthesis
VAGSSQRPFHARSPSPDLKSPVSRKSKPDSSVKVAFASGSDDLIPEFLERVAAIYPELELFVVSEFPPAQGRWIPYHVGRSFADNLALFRSSIAGRRIRIAAMLVQPRMPFRRMRLIPLLIAPFRTLIYNENLDHFMLRPQSAVSMLRHFAWRLKNFARWQTQAGGHLYTFGWRLRHPSEFRLPMLYAAARVAGEVAAAAKAALPAKTPEQPVAGLPQGVSVVIPSRSGRELLAKILPNLQDELAAISPVRSEIIVVDNGSEDGSASFIREHYPGAIVVEVDRPLSFAKAVNLGLSKAGYSHALLLNNDMQLHPGFFGPLLKAFEQVPDLFCATAQIFFPEGERRQETGKAFMWPLEKQRRETAFPVRCELPLAQEDLTYVLYGSGGCSLVDMRKTRALSGLGEMYEPAYVEDLDFGFRAWQRGWPSVFVAAAQVTHQHRTTTSKYFSQAELDRVLEINYLRFLARCVGSPALFTKLWKAAIERLKANALAHDDAALHALAAARNAPAWIEPAPRNMKEEDILALTSGALAVFPGMARTGRPLVLIAAPYIPFPLSHGGAVRMYNLMRRAASHYDQVLITFTDELSTPPQELLDICTEIVQVKRIGSHTRPATGRPDVVEEFDSTAFHAALRQTCKKWKPRILQLEFTQMAQYAKDCEGAKTLLVEHDITFDLYQQMLAEGPDWELRRQWERWAKFERQAWGRVDCVVTMSEKDRHAVRGARQCVSLGNGVDLDRFRPSNREPERGRLLFIGSFAHLPNLLAIDFFLKDVWPLLSEHAPTLHIIAGSRHRYFLELHRTRASIELDQPGVEVDDFVSDVRPAYERASIVVAPLRASAGTNIKIMEAMAMGKAIVSTPGGVNGLDLGSHSGVVVTEDGPAMARVISELLHDVPRRQTLEAQARKTAEEKYDWNRIARVQEELYRDLLD